MKNSEIRALTFEELTQKIISEKEAMQKLKFAHAISPVENPMKLRATRKMIARLKTALRQKQLEK
jgi:large subunit ribosomal protein L29